MVIVIKKLVEKVDYKIIFTKKQFIYIDQINY